MRNNIVVGTTLAALQYAHQQDAKLILNNIRFPEKFEKVYIKEAWGLLYTTLALKGCIIGGDGVKTVKVNPETLQIIGDHNIINEVAYEKLFIFDEKNIIGLPDIIDRVDKNTVIDVLEGISLTSPPVIQTINTNDKLVNKLYIRKETQQSAIELFAVSLLTQKELTLFDYSDTMVKFKSEELLKKNNFVGSFPRGNSPRHPIELEVKKRIVKKHMDKYQETDRIKFFYGNS